LKKEKEPFAPFVPLKRVTSREKITDIEGEKVKEIPSIHAVRLASFDNEHKIEPSSIVKVSITDDTASIQDFFDGVVLHEDVDVETVIGDEENKKWLTEKQKIELRKKAKNGSLGEVEVKEKVVLVPQEGRPLPSFLPIQLARFRKRYLFDDNGLIRFDKEHKPMVLMEKVKTVVEAPFYLSVPIESGKKETYILRSIVVHLGGSSIKSGHYVTYFPDQASSLNAEGYPTKWFEHSDSTISERLDWKDVKNNIQTQGYLFYYDHESAVKSS
jgi:hypothetical protein